MKVDRVELLEVSEDMSAEVRVARAEGDVERITQGGEFGAERIDQPAATSGDRLVAALTDGTESEVSLGSNCAAGYPTGRDAATGRGRSRVRQQVEDVVGHRSH